MNSTLRIWTAAIVLLMVGAACSRVAVTGRKQLDIVPDGQVLAMSAEQYTTFLSENPVSADPQATETVQGVGKRISAAVEQFLRDHDLADEIQHYDWEFNVVDSDQPNAWCMPGGKVVFYTGILPICEDETGVAVVMGHEVAHAVAKHGQERMSQQLLQSAGAVAVAIATDGRPEGERMAFMAAYGLGTQVGIMLPFSRTHESEADQLGLYFMAMAGYDPHEAVAFWERMGAQAGEKPPEFLSTHPSDETRINGIKEHLPEAMEHYPGE